MDKQPFLTAVKAVSPAERYGEKILMQQKSVDLPYGTSTDFLFLYFS